MTTEGTLRHFPHDEPTDELQFPPIRNVDGKYDDVSVSVSATFEGVLVSSSHRWRCPLPLPARSPS